MPWQYQQTLQREGVVQDFMKCHRPGAATGMSECGRVPPHRARGQATDGRYLSGMLRMKTGMEKTSRPPRCGFSYPQPQNGGLPEEIWKTPQRAKSDLIDKLFSFPQNSEADILQGMSRHSESSSLQTFTPVAACPPLPKWCSHRGHGPGISKPSV